MQLPPMWQVTPIALIALVAGVAHEMGVRRLGVRQTPTHRLGTRRRSWIFYGALVLLALVTSGPFARWGMESLVGHMVVHVLEMFYLPPLLVLSAPVVPLLFSVPVVRRRRLLRALCRSRATPWIRQAHRVFVHPAVAIVAFNATMVLWHVPVIFDWMSSRDWVMNWLMGPSFLCTGILFWRVILPSRPWGARGRPRMQVAAIVLTGFEMLVLAMAMSILTRAPWYSTYVAMHGPVVALRDQRWAAGVLWVCGDFWAIPALIVVLLRGFAQGGGVSATIERALGRA